MIPVLFAIGISFTVILMTIFLSKQFQSSLIGATALCSIAFIYVGFSLQGNPVNLIVMEIAIAAIFYFIALIGYIRNVNIIAFGILLHGVWDILHQDALVIKTNIPSYYPLFCSITDVILAVFFYWYFTMQRRRNDLVNR